MFCVPINTVPNCPVPFFTMAIKNGDKSSTLSRPTLRYYTFIAFSTHSCPSSKPITRITHQLMTSLDRISMGTFPFRHFLSVASTCSYELLLSVLFFSCHVRASSKTCLHVALVLVCVNRNLFPCLRWLPLYMYIHFDLLHSISCVHVHA